MDEIFYVSCERFYPTKEYEEFSPVRGKKEIVSYDCGLMPPFNICYSLNDAERKVAGIKDGQIIAAYQNPPQNFAINIGNGFEFCGFDLSEEQTNISAITNCNGFEATIDYANLNDYGLISDYEVAKLTREKLEEKFPDECHACCEIYALWRKISK